MSVVDLIRGEAIRQGIPPDLALAVARRESALNPNARGAAGEVGLFQLMPGTASDLGVNPYDIGQNIRGGVSYLRQQFERFGDWATALAAYNAGPGRAHNPPSSTRGYVAAVMSAWGAPSAEPTPQQAPQRGSGWQPWQPPQLVQPLTATAEPSSALAVVAVGLLLVGVWALRR